MTWTFSQARGSSNKTPNSSSSVCLPVGIKIHSGGLLDSDTVLPEAGEVINAFEMPGNIVYTGIEIMSGPNAPWAGGTVLVGYAASKPAYNSQYHNQPNGQTIFDDPEYFSGATPLAVSAVKRQVITGVPKFMATHQESREGEARGADHWLTFTPTAAPAVDDELFFNVYYNIIG